MQYIVKCETQEHSQQVVDYYEYKVVFDERKFVRISDNKVEGFDKRLQYYTDNYPTYTTITFEEWKKSLSKPKENNMEYLIHTEDKAQFKIVAEHYQWTNYLEGSIKSAPDIYVVNEKVMEYTTEVYHKTNQYDAKPNTPVIPFTVWAAIKGITYKPSKTLELTKDYSAEVNYNTKIVQVGCQSIPFSKVEELAKLIKE